MPRGRYTSKEMEEMMRRDAAGHGVEKYRMIGEDDEDEPPKKKLNVNEIAAQRRKNELEALEARDRVKKQAELLAAMNKIHRLG